MRAAPVLRAVSAGVTRREVQAVVIGLVALVSTAAVTLALGPRAEASAPFDRAFAAQHGSEVTATAKASPVQLAATTGLAGVTAAAGPFPETTVRRGEPGTPVTVICVPMPTGEAWPSASSTACPGCVAQ